MKFDSIGSKSPTVETKKIHKVIVNIPAAIVQAISMKALKEKASLYLLMYVHMLLRMLLLIKYKVGDLGA